MATSTTVAFWFRRDLRWVDNHGLYEAFHSGYQVCPVFIFDNNILNTLPKDDPRVEFIYNSLADINQKFEEFGSGLIVEQGNPVECWAKLIKKYKFTAIFTNHDYEPYALTRDKKMKDLCEKEGVGFLSFKDQVIFEKCEVLTDKAQPYKVFTPYAKKWKKRLNEQGFKVVKSEYKLANLKKLTRNRFPSLKEIGFKASGLEFPACKIQQKVLKEYGKKRNFPALGATSHIGVHLRFGTLSIRSAVALALKHSEVWLNELIWREFFMMLLYHFPHTKDKSFKPEYDKIRWRNDENDFEAWRWGQTGYPMVDAGMRELAQTGYMHNRVRMITASFLCKHLLIDWKWGEAWFAKKLLDYEMASNVGNWQWAAGSGADASPYFRVFNPDTQLEKFDSKNEYVSFWVPEVNRGDYVLPIVNHNDARQRALRVYARALKKGGQ